MYRMPLTDGDIEAAIREARNDRAATTPHLSHPSGRRLDFDDPKDAQVAHSLMVARQGYAGGGGVRQDAPPRFSIPYTPIGLAGGVPVALPAPVAAPAHHGNDINSIIASALSVAREPWATGGSAFGSNPLLHAMPCTVAPVSAPSLRAHLPGGITPVLPLNLAAGFARHATKMRARYDDGGDASSGNGDNGGGNGDTAGNAGNTGSDPTGGYGIGGFGGAVGAVSSGTTNTNDGGSFNSGPSYSSMSLGNTGVSTSIGDTANAISGLGL